jgi:hypothetical protein
LVLIAAIPGLALLALSAVLFLVSLTALLLLAAPVYSLLRRALAPAVAGLEPHEAQQRQATARVIESEVVERQADGHG